MAVEPIVGAFGDTELRSVVEAADKLKVLSSFGKTLPMSALKNAGS